MKQYSTELRTYKVADFEAGKQIWFEHKSGHRMMLAKDNGKYVIIGSDAYGTKFAGKHDGGTLRDIKERFKNFINGTKG